MRVAQLTVVMAESDSESFWATAYPIIPHPAEIIIGLISFAILYWVVAKFAVPAFEKAFAERATAIEGGMAKAEQAQAEAAAALVEYRQQLAEARAEASRIREEARAEGAAIIKQMQEQAQTEANRITAAATAQIQAERQQAMVQLRGEVGGLATSLASKIVGESLHDETRASGVIDRFLGELDATPARN